MTTKPQSTTTKLEATLEPSLEDVAIEAAELLDSLPTYVSDQTIRRAQQIAFALRACTENARARVSANGAPTVDHDWRWYDTYLRATGYTDLANRMLAEFRPRR